MRWSGEKKPQLKHGLGSRQLFKSTTELTCKTVLSHIFIQVSALELPFQLWRGTKDSHTFISIRKLTLSQPFPSHISGVYSKHQHHRNEDDIWFAFDGLIDVIDGWMDWLQEWMISLQMEWFNPPSLSICNPSINVKSLFIKFHVVIINRLFSFKWIFCALAMQLSDTQLCAHVTADVSNVQVSKWWSIVTTDCKQHEEEMVVRIYLVFLSGSLVFFSLQGVTGSW